MSVYIFPSAKEGSDSWPQCLPLAVNAYGEPLGSELLMGFEGDQGGVSIVLLAAEHPVCVGLPLRGGVAHPGALS